MFAKLETYLKEGFAYTGLEITGSEGSEAFSLLELKKSKNELVITNKRKLNHWNQLSEFIPKNNLLFLCINTTSVLVKKMENANTKNPEAIVNQAFPNLDLNNFYFEIIQLETEPIVSISKKESIDTVIEKLKELNIKIFRFSLGISAIPNVISYMENGPAMVSYRQLHFEDKNIIDIGSVTSQTEQQYHINGLQLSSKHMLSFSQILGHLNQKPHITNFEAVCENLKWTFKNYRIFNQFLKYSLAFFIILLLSNFFVYNFYHVKVVELNMAMAATSSQQDELGILDASVKRKQERVETLSSSSNSKATYYLDLFAQNIPASILLNEIKYQPLSKPVRESKPILLEEETIMVSGISKNMNDFSFWIEELEKHSWVNSVETLDYDYISKNTSNFLIEISFHED